MKNQHLFKPRVLKNRNSIHKERMEIHELKKLYPLRSNAFIPQAAIAQSVCSKIFSSMKSRTSDKTRLSQKRGQGRMGLYKPWILIHEISSMGNSWRILGSKTGRVHHLLSTLGKKVYLNLDSVKA